MARVRVGRGLGRLHSGVCALAVSCAFAVGQARADDGAARSELVPGATFKNARAGYSFRASSEPGWTVEWSGHSRHAFELEDDASLWVWAARPVPGAASDAAACEQRVATEVQARARARNADMLREGGPSSASGERRDAQWRSLRGVRGLSASVSAGGACYGFVALVSADALPRTWTEVEKAHASFAVFAPAETARAPRAMRALVAEAAASLSGRDVARLEDAAIALTLSWPQRAEGWHFTGLVAQARGDDDGALAAWGASVKLPGGATEVDGRRARSGVHLLIAQLEMKRARWAEARGALDAALALMPAHPVVLTNEAALLALQGKPAAALETLERVLKAWPEQARPAEGLPWPRARQVELIREDPRFEALSANPAFEALLRRASPSPAE